MKLLTKAYNDLDEIYYYIITELDAEQAANNLINDLEEMILSLEFMQYRGAKRRNETYANKGYRHLFVKNFTIIYRIDEVKKEVIVITVRYSKRESL